MARVCAFKCGLCSDNGHTLDSFNKQRSAKDFAILAAWDQNVKSLELIELI